MVHARQTYRWFVAEDINGFFGLIFDNLTVLSFLSGILVLVFKFPADIVYTRMFPGTALGVLVGDLIYTCMAFNLARRTGNQSVTAMPLGLDTHRRSDWRWSSWDQRLSISNRTATPSATPR